MIRKVKWKDTLEAVFREATPQGGDIWVENEGAAESNMQGTAFKPGEQHMSW